MRIINEFDVSGTIHQFCMYGLFGVRTWCNWALESDSPWLMWTRIPYSARIGLSVRQYVGEAARKPILQPQKKTDGNKRKKRTECYGIPNFRRFRKSLAISSVHGMIVHRSVLVALGECKEEIGMPLFGFCALFVLHCYWD